MEGPHVAVHMDENGNVIYGYDRGLTLISIHDVIIHKNEVFLLVQWEGDEMLEAVPAVRLGEKYPMIVIEYLESISTFPTV